MIHKTQVQHAPHDDLPFLSTSLIVSLILLAVKPKDSRSARSLPCHWEYETSYEVSIIGIDCAGSKDERIREVRYACAFEGNILVTGRVDKAAYWANGAGTTFATACTLSSANELDKWRQIVEETANVIMASI